MKAFFATISMILLFHFLLTAQDATLSVQGTVQKSSGAAIEDGNYEMTFKLYTTPTGGAPEWTETQTGIEIVGGVYSALLGTTEPLSASFDATYYLGVSVDGSTELQPRARLTSAPYALSLLGSGNKFPSNGAIGAGTASPNQDVQLHVKNDDGEGKLITEGSNRATYGLKAGPHNALLSLDENALMTINSPSAMEIHSTNDLFIKRDGDIKLQVKEQETQINGDLNFSAGSHIKYGNHDDWRLVSVDDFEDGSTQGWICQENWNNTVSRETKLYTLSNPFFEGNFLGPKVGGWQALAKKFDLTGIPHTKVKVVFTYVFHSTWDPDEWAYALFSENQNIEIGKYLVGYTKRQVSEGSFSYSGGPAERVTMTANSSDDDFWIIVSSGLNEVASNENFWIDDVEIWVK